MYNKKWDIKKDKDIIKSYNKHMTYEKGTKNNRKTEKITY
jgi:hypothetical protein